MSSSTILHCPGLPWPVTALRKPGGAWFSGTVLKSNFFSAATRVEAESTRKHSTAAERQQTRTIIRRDFRRLRSKFKSKAQLGWNRKFTPSEQAERVNDSWGRRLPKITCF